jgi:hypothetical protein
LVANKLLTKPPSANPATLPDNSKTPNSESITKIEYLTTETGQKVHRAFLDSIYQQLIQTKTQTKQ